MKEVKYKFEFASKISGIFGKRDPEKPGISRKFGNGEIARHPGKERKKKR